MKTLGLILDQIVFEHGGAYSTDEPFIRFVESVASASSFERIEFCSRVLPARVAAPYELDPSLYEIRRLPWYPNILTLCAKSPALFTRISRLLNGLMPEWDMVVACGVHPLTSLALRMAKRRGIPSQLWMRGNVMADVRFRYHGAHRLAAAAAVSATTACIPSGTPVVSIGRDDYPFFRRMGPVHVAFDSKFGEEDLAGAPHAPRPPDEPPRLLYVGRIAPEKGLEFLLEAMSLLHSQFPTAPPVLTLVGSDFHGSSYGEAFRRRLEDSSIADSVTMAGHIPYGRALFDFYDSHDVLVLPSLTEGFPQVLLEAMARGLPVVATRVGGVPRVVKDGANGLLVSAGDAKALAATIGRLLADRQLSSRLASEGLRSARTHARQAQVASIVNFTAECLQPAATQVTPERHTVPRMAR